MIQPEVLTVWPGDPWGTLRLLQGSVVETLFLLWPELTPDSCSKAASPSLEQELTCLFESQGPKTKERSNMKRKTKPS